MAIEICNTVAFSAHVAGLMYNMYMRELSVAETRAELPDVLARAAYRGEPTIVTKRGVRYAAVVPVELLDAALQALGRLKSPAIGDPVLTAATALRYDDLDDYLQERLDELTPEARTEALETGIIPARNPATTPGAILDWIRALAGDDPEGFRAGLAQAYKESRGRAL